jgi:hypothetical protein
VSWGLYRWVWLVESPLAIGAPPAGSLNRCRLYVPARALWGALTAESARAAAGTGLPAYEKTAKRLAQDARLSYLFPAESIENRWLAWLPRYEEGRGLVWCREDGTSTVDDRTFRYCLLTARASTAIDPRNEAAAEGSLRETECIADRWRGSRNRVAMTGYVFVREGAEFSPTQDFVIHVGGDTRYGLGRLLCIEVTEHDRVDGRVFGRAVACGERDPQIASCTALAHADAPGEADAEPRGDLELLSGWDRSRLEALGDRRPLWVPGSSWQRELSWEITPEEGFWKLNTQSA